MKKSFIYTLSITALLATGCRETRHRNPAPQPPPKPERVEGLYMGVVGFNNNVTITPVTDDMTVVKNSINGLTNEPDATALCYGITKGLDQLTTADRKQDFDMTYMVVFTDGFDNYSSNYFPGVYQDQVVDYTRDILNNAVVSGKPVRVYTLGLSGKGTLKDDELRDLAVNGSYRRATSSTLNNTFQEIANAVMSTAKNVEIVTNAVPISTANPKYVQVTVSATAGRTTSHFLIEGQLTNEDGQTPRFTINYVTPGITFDDAGGTVHGTVVTRNGIKKAVLPLSNMAIAPLNGTDAYTVQKIVVKIKYKPADNYVEDVEDTKTEDAIAKNVGIILVLDCSQSLGQDFVPMKNYAKEFVNTIMTKKK